MADAMDRVDKAPKEQAYQVRDLFVYGMLMHPHLL